MSPTIPRALSEIRSIEATPQATRREIALESHALLRPDVHSFNELLVQ